MNAFYKAQNQAGPRKSRILVVDDHPIVRQGLALLINQEADLLVCGEAEEASGAMHVLASSKPDVLIVDISLNGPDGIDLLKNIRNVYPTLPVLIHSGSGHLPLACSRPLAITLQLPFLISRARRG